MGGQLGPGNEQLALEAQGQIAQAAIGIGPGGAGAQRGAGQAEGRDGLIGRAVGVRAEVRLRDELAAEQEAGGAGVALPGTGMAEGKKRILIINDTKEILELFRDILGPDGMGFDVTLMSYAPDELSRIVAEKPDLVVVDFVIGDREMLGWQLRMSRETAEIPIIACTAAAKQVRESEAYLVDQGIEVVLKPFTIAQLEHAVRNALKLDEEGVQSLSDTAKL